MIDKNKVFCENSYKKNDKSQFFLFNEQSPKKYSKKCQIFRQF